MKDLTEEDLPKLILIEDLGTMYPTENSKKKARYGIYKCGFCGNEFRSLVQDVKSNKIKSCGCYRKRRVSETHKTHGLKNTRLYIIWANIKARTLNPKHKQYSDYGGRGITICEEWKNDFVPFYNWAMLNGYEENKGLSIDRIDNNGNYEPSNCRWTTQTIQCRNRRVRKDNTSGYKGVSSNKRDGNYQASIYIKSKKISLGYFQTTLEGAISYNNYIIENNLEGFILNEIPEVQK